MKDQTVLVSGAITYKKGRGKDWWLLVKRDVDSDWEIPLTNVRKVESSVRASIRTMQEMGGMRVKVLAEAGRSGGSTVVNGKTVPLRYLYYLIKYLDEAGEPIGFHEMKWFGYAEAVRKLKQKRDRAMIKAAREELERLRKSEEGQQLLQE